MQLVPKQSRRLAQPPLAGNPTARPKVKLRGYVPTNHLTQQQADNLRTIVDTYAPDLHDPAAVEVLLVLLEVCHILDVSGYRMRKIFGARQLHGLETWGDILPPKRRPAQLQRAWVWPPNTYQPKLYPIAADGTIRIYGEPPGEQSEESNPPASIA